LEDNEEVVEVGTWEDPVGSSGEGDEEMVLLAMQGAKVLHASTAWIEHNDAHGLEKFEPARNVEIVELSGYDARTDGQALVEDLKSIIQAPFRTMADFLHPSSQPSALLANLVSSAATPLFTALIFLLPTVPTQLDRKLIDSLAEDIPIILLPVSHPQPTHHLSRSRTSSPALRPSSSLVSPSRPRGAARPSSFRPRSATELKNGLFASPQTIATLRTEAAERFLRWREVERAVASVLPPDTAPLTARRETFAFPRGLSASRDRSALRPRPARERWDKERWEREWMADLSCDAHATLVERRQGRSGAAAADDVFRADWRPPPSYHSGSSPCLSESLHEHSARRDEERRPDARLVGQAGGQYAPIPHLPSFDPLHLPSLLLFAASLLGPLKARIAACIGAPFGRQDGAAAAGRRGKARDGVQYAEGRGTGWFVVGGLVGVGLCVGMGVGAAWSTVQYR